MANARGLSRDLIIHPGETLREVLFDRRMTQKELALRTGRTEQHVSRVVKGTNSITATFAKRLEYALDIPAYFWNNLQRNYDLELADYKDRHEISEEEYGIFRKTKEVMQALLQLLGLDVEEDETFGVVQARKVLKLADLTLMSKPELSAAYRTAGAADVDQYVNYVWNKLCDAHLERERASEFLGIDELVRRIPEIKTAMFAENINDGITSLKNLFSGLGIRFSVVRHYKGAPHHGRVNRNSDGGLDICVTIRRSRADIFWFSLFHEIAHILNGDLDKKVHSKADDQRADQLAASLLMPDKHYNEFVKQGDFGLHAIARLGKKAGVPRSIVVGRLQKDGLLAWNKYRGEIRYLKWKK